MIIHCLLARVATWENLSRTPLVAACPSLAAAAVEKSFCQFTNIYHFSLSLFVLTGYKNVVNIVNNNNNIVVRHSL